MGGVQRGGGIFKIRGKGGKKGGGGRRGRCRKRVGGIFWGGGVLNIYFEGRGATLVKNTIAKSIFPLRTVTSLN